MNWEKTTNCFQDGVRCDPDDPTLELQHIYYNCHDLVDFEIDYRYLAQKKWCLSANRYLLGGFYSLEEAKKYAIVVRDYLVKVKSEQFSEEKMANFPPWSNIQHAIDHVMSIHLQILFRRGFESSFEDKA